MPIKRVLYKSFDTEGGLGHPIAVAIDLDRPESGVSIIVGGSRAMVSRVTSDVARAIAAELVGQADRLDRGPAIREVPIQAGPPPIPADDARLDAAGF